MSEQQTKKKKKKTISTRVPSRDDLLDPEFVEDLDRVREWNEAAREARVSGAGLARS